MKTFRKYLSAGVGLAALMLASAASAAEVRWSLAFFDDDANQVGSGYFTYNKTTTDFVSDQYAGDTTSGYSIDSLLTSFQASFEKITINSVSGDAWWADETHQPASMLYPKGTPYYRENFWLAGYNLIDIADGMSIDNFTQLNDTTWVGDWSYYFAQQGSFCDVGFVGICDWGSWVATQDHPSWHGLVRPVPLPAALPLFAGAIGALAAATRRRRRH